MNIFILDHDPRQSIQYHMDAHVRKMCIEYVQILCTVLRQRFPDHPDIDLLYKSTHINHPCVKWARDNWANWVLLHKYAVLLHFEYVHRYNKNHKSYLMLENTYPIFLNSWAKCDTPHTPFVQCVPHQYRQDDPVAAYRAYYIGEKQHLAKWTGRPIPEWFEVVE